MNDFLRLILNESLFKVMYDGTADEMKIMIPALD